MYTSFHKFPGQIPGLKLFFAISRYSPDREPVHRNSRLFPVFPVLWEPCNLPGQQLINDTADTQKYAVDVPDANNADSNDAVSSADSHGTTETEHRGDSINNQQVNDHPQEQSAMRNRVVNRYILPTGNERYDMLIFFSNVRDRLRNYLQSRARELGGIKWNLCVQVEMGRDDVNEIASTSPYFRSRTYITLSGEGLSEHNLNEAIQKMYESLEKFMREESGWYVKKVLKLEIQTIVYKPLHGSAYIPLPASLSKSGSLLNIGNSDDKCFLYCLLASLHPEVSEPECVERYYKFSNEVNMSGITYPVTLSQIKKVEH